MEPVATILDRIIAMTTVVITLSPAGNPLCPTHKLEAAHRTSRYGGFWSCPLRECKWTLDDKDMPQGPLQPAPVARSAPVVAPTSSDVSPRFQAACVALQAAAYGPGSPAEVMDRAARYYHYFLKPSFTGDVPVPTVPVTNEST